MLLTDPKKERKHPPHLQSYMEDTRKVIFHVRGVIQKKMLVLLAMCLEISEDQMLETHASGKSSSEYYRYVSPLDWVVKTDSRKLTFESDELRSIDTRSNSKFPWTFMPGHADWGTFSILFWQPVCALQILDKSGVPKWVEVRQPHEFLPTREIDKYSSTSLALLSFIWDKRSSLSLEVYFQRQFIVL